MSRTTRTLVAVLAGALALDAWLRRPSAPDEVDRLPAFALEEVTAVRIHEGDDAFTLTRTRDGWTLPGPPDRAADPGRVEELLAGLSRGVPLDAQVDRGGFENYGLAGADPVRVDVLGPGEAPISSLVLGFDAGGGATWVRRPGDDAVFRARVGGRGRYDRPRAAWRDRGVLAMPDLRRIEIERSEGSYALVTGETWRVEGSDFPVDPVLAREVGRVLSDLRALDLAPAAAAPPASEALARVNLVATSKTSQLTVWPSIVTLEGEDAAFRLAPALTALLGGPLEAWRDHTLWSADPASVTELRLDEDEQVVLARTDAGWVVVRPAGVSVDPQRVAALAAVLANPRVEAWVDASPADARFLAGTRLVVALGDERRTLEIGGPVPGRPPGKEAVYLRDPRRPDRIGTWSAPVWANVRAGFGR